MAAPTLDFTNIQGDILQGLPKRFQTFVFFQIADATKFKKQFKAVIPFITTTQQVLDAEKAIADHKASGGIGLLTLAQANISFSAKGLAALGIPDELGDQFFTSGQLADATAAGTGLGDPTAADGSADWDPLFKQDIHGCLTVTGESQLTINAQLATITLLLLGAIKILGAESGAVRPGNEAGHEHFGFDDGLSNPPIIGFRNPNTGEDPTPASVILLNQDGVTPRQASWAKDSSFFVFRKLRQLVPEFHTFLNQNPIKDAGLTPEQGSALLGARLVGRWPSGAPVDRDPTQDNPADAQDVNKVNDFDYSDDPNQVRCPFAGHLRKVNPRNSPVGPGLANVRPHRIIRQGIPYGPEVSFLENAAGKTSLDRGLLFTCYQSDLSKGFHFLQKTWANNTNFPSSGDGFDAIIGQNGTAVRTTGGTDPQNVGAQLTLPQLWVVPRGGEYFVAPSISALKSTFSSA